MTTTNSTTGFKPDFFDRWAIAASQARKIRDKKYDTNIAAVNLEVQHLLQLRRA